MSHKNDFNDRFVMVAVGAGVVGGVLTGSVAVGFFVAVAADLHSAVFTPNTPEK